MQALHNLRKNQQYTSVVRPKKFVETHFCKLCVINRSRVRLYFSIHEKMASDATGSTRPRAYTSRSNKASGQKILGSFYAFLLTYTPRAATTVNSRSRVLLYFSTHENMASDARGYTRPRRPKRSTRYISSTNTQDRIFSEVSTPFLLVYTPIAATTVDATPAKMPDTSKKRCKKACAGVSSLPNRRRWNRIG